MMLTPAWLLWSLIWLKLGWVSQTLTWLCRKAPLQQQARTAGMSQARFCCFQLHSVPFQISVFAMVSPSVQLPRGLSKLLQLSWTSCIPHGDKSALLCSAGAEGASDKATKGLRAREAREAAKLAVRCAVCEEPAKSSWLQCPSCTSRAHLPCLATHYIQVCTPCSSSCTHVRKHLFATCRLVMWVSSLSAHILMHG